jgi:hypothetical protein
MAHAVEAASPGKRSAGRMLGLVVIAILAAGAIAAGSFYQEEIKGYMALQAWNQNAPRQAVADFVRASHSKDNAALSNLMAPGVFTLEKEPDGRVKSIKWVDHRGVVTRPPGKIVPSGEPKVVDPVMRKRGDAHFYSVVTQFANGEWGVFRVEPRDGKFVISELPAVMDKERPKDLTMY